MVPATHVQDDLSGETLLKGLAAEDEAADRGLALIQKEQASYWPLMSEDIAATQPRAKRNKNKDWDGSATPGENVVQLSNLYTCQFCKVGWPQASFLAHVDADMAFGKDHSKHGVYRFPEVLLEPNGRLCQVLPRETQAKCAIL